MDLGVLARNVPPHARYSNPDPGPDPHPNPNPHPPLSLALALALTLTLTFTLTLTLLLTLTRCPRAQCSSPRAPSASSWAAGLEPRSRTSPPSSVVCTGWPSSLRFGFGLG